MKKVLLLLLVLPYMIYSQDYVKGKIIDDQLTPLFNATVHWINTTSGTTTDESGEFEITRNNIIDNRLIISFIGFKADTVEVKYSQNTIIRSLEPSNTLNNIQLTENATGIYIDKSKALKLETITAKELTKAACCDLAGCFETQISVQAKTTNVIMDAKELSLLGLSGVYNQILIDGIPLVTGLNYTYGVSSIPGSLINKIHISQGLASVLQGPQSITGQINIELKENAQKEIFFLNLYQNSFGSKQANLDYNYNVGKWKSIISLHSTQPAKKYDHNNDTFLDMPQTTKYSLYNKWTYGNPVQGLYTITTLRYLNERRVGGQMDFDLEEDKGGNIFYGQVIDFQQPELYNKVSYRFNQKHAIKCESGFSYHDQEAYYGTTHYTADQFNYNINIAHILNWKSHKLTSGLNLNRIKVNEHIDFDDTFNKTYTGIPKNEQIPGVFLENNFSWNSGNSQLITSLRADHHNQHGLFITPRALMKYDFSENSIIRFSIGSGWRTINLFSEHSHLLTSNKNIVIADNLKPEKAVNYGFNILQAIYMKNIEIQMILDCYKTDFSNQIYPDYQYNSLEILVNNFEGTSKSNSVQVEIGLEIMKNLGIKIAYNYLDVFQIHENGKKVTRPFNSKHHILNTFSYHPINKNWYIDLNAHWSGEKQLMNTSGLSYEEQEANTSEPYWIINSQLTKEIKSINLDIYFGCENILNFRQQDPITSWEDPFGENFDISNIWGPTKGREFYIGIRTKF